MEKKIFGKIFLVGKNFFGLMLWKNKIIFET